MNKEQRINLYARYKLAENNVFTALWPENRPDVGVNQLFLDAINQVSTSKWDKKRFDYIKHKLETAVKCRAEHSKCFIGASSQSRDRHAHFADQLANLLKIMDQSAQTNNAAAENIVSEVVDYSADDIRLIDLLLLEFAEDLRRIHDAAMQEWSRLTDDMVNLSTCSSGLYAHE